MPSTSCAPYRVYNIGNNEPVELSRFIEVIEEALGKKAEKNLLPMQPGDVPATYADIDALESAVGFRPSTSIEEGVQRFIEWYRDYLQGLSRLRPVNSPRYRSLAAPLAGNLANQASGSASLQYQGSLSR